MKKILFISTIIFSFFKPVFSQETGLIFSSSDEELTTAFHRAKAMALQYQGNPNDPVGPWYEASLPDRYAFCMRDVSHQSLPAEMLGMGAANKNMMLAFVSNISDSKDWCTFWEINKFNKPAPEDYRNDTAFWYNLPANFDLITACWRLYLWTGDKDYIDNAVFRNFYEKSTHEFVDRWVLQPDSLLIRPGYPNELPSFNLSDAFHRCRGLPSYSEGVHDMKMGIDLVAALYSGMVSYAAMLEANGQPSEAKSMAMNALSYQKEIDQYWWDESAGRYNTYYSNKHQFGKDEGELYLLWFNALKNRSRKKKTIERLITEEWNIETQSYFPYLFFKEGYWSEAVRSILHLTDPQTKRREYPEVSYGVILGFVNGLMGIQPDARFNRVATVYKTNAVKTSSLENIPLLGTNISVRHNLKETEFSNNGSKPLIWRAEFYGRHHKIIVDGQSRKTKQIKDETGKSISYTDIKVEGGKKINAFVK